jgi:hypothetical protein
VKQLRFRIRSAGFWLYIEESASPSAASDLRGAHLCRGEINADAMTMVRFLDKSIDFSAVPSDSSRQIAWNAVREKKKPTFSRADGIPAQQFVSRDGSTFRI